MQDAPRQRCALWHLSVANGSKSVHPIGHPISHSTQSGFNFPLVLLTTMPKLTCLPFAILRCTTLVPMWPLSLQSDD